MEWSVAVIACTTPSFLERPPLSAQTTAVPWVAHFVSLSSFPLISSPNQPVLFSFLSPFTPVLCLSLHFSVLVSSHSIIVYLHSVHFLPSLMALRWGVFLVRNCNEDWNTISWMATVSFLHHLCCCRVIDAVIVVWVPVCSYWCARSTLSRYG